MMLPVIDLHCDTIYQLYTHPQSTLAHNQFQLDLPKMQKANYLLQNFAIFIDKNEFTHPYQTALAMIQRFKAELAKNRHAIQQVTCYDDILSNQQTNKISALLTLEGGEIIEGNLGYLEHLYTLGARMMTLTWNYPNSIGFPNSIYWQANTQQLCLDQEGLTNFGIEVVEKMNQLKMIIDVSHGSDQLVLDVLKHSHQPIVASHSNARGLCKHPRNLSDDLLRQIANHQGLVGLNFYEYFLKDPASNQHLTDAVIDHIKYITNLIGTDHLAFGSDFDGISVHPDLPNAEIFSIFIHKLQKAGFSSSEIEKIFYRNVLQFYKKNL